MRLLCVGNRYPPWSLGGYERDWSRAVERLTDAGHTVRVLTTTPDPTDRPGAPTAGTDVHRELRWYWHAHTWPRRRWREVVALERHNQRVLAGQLLRFAPDVVCWWSMGGMSLSLIEAARRAGLPALGWVGDDWLVYGPQVDPWSRLARRLGPATAALERWTGVPAQIDLDRAARWLCVSEYVRTAAREAGHPLPDSAVLSSGVDPEQFPPAEAQPWEWRLLYCGRIDPRKGVADAIRALSELPAEATLSLVGDGEAEYLAELGALAAELGVSGRVSVHGALRGTALREAYAAADVVVFPVTWREPWGLVPLEAMSVNRPLVATRAGGGAAEYLRADENSLLVSPADPGALAAAVRQLAADPALRARLVAGGRATAARHTAAAFDQGLEAELLRLVGR